MKNVLWVSLMAPYDNVSHASGKIQNFYLKHLAKNKDLKVRLISFCKPDELEKIDLDKYNIPHNIYVRPRGGFINEMKRGIAWASKLFIMNKYAGLTTLEYQIGMRKMINQLRKEKYTPDVIILDWTEILFFLSKMKKIWPKAKFVAIEEDVSYLGLQRKGKYYNNFFSRTFFGLKEKRVKKKEISFLNQANLAIFNNKKDLLLAQNDGFTGEYIVWSVYYQTFLNREINPNNNKDIVFYGSMSREENWKSCIWFIEKVLPLIQDKDFKFIIVGGNPNPKLLSYQSERVIIKGFVEDVGVELANSMCLVAPLVMGAGIKVKIIEAMSIGLPVITNDIGIEGIPAKDGEEYYYCSSPNDYSSVIERICMNIEEAKKIGEKSKKMIVNNFNYHSDAALFEEKIVNL